MTDLPYTTADLRAEAARQHAAHTARPHCGQTYAAMLDAHIESTRTADGGMTWAEALDGRDLDTAAEEVHDLITGADNVSAWAVTLGTTSLEPQEPFATRDGDIGMYYAAAQLAIHSGLPAARRAELYRELRAAFETTVARVLRMDNGPRRDS
ncbi:hypothetical protein [Streptomyces jumonjinensis]|uniref:hypothetical protein n=1 Tax=Streptomyces jumonjinensis TaxID=1945 RepID=UPI0037B1446C